MGAGQSVKVPEKCVPALNQTVNLHSTVGKARTFPHAPAALWPSTDDGGEGGSGRAEWQGGGQNNGEGAKQEVGRLQGRVDLAAMVSPGSYPLFCSFPTSLLSLH